MKLSRQEFEIAVSRVLRRIPREIRKYFKYVNIVIRSRPSQKLLREMGMPPGETLLGLYEGTPLTERSVMDSLEYPDFVYLFQRPLEQMCASMQELEREIEITMVHEVAHYVGLSDEQLTELGYD
jgi:predicted Zn-dependent protease with MMP-like domain